MLTEKAKNELNCEVFYMDSAERAVLYRTLADNLNYLMAKYDLNVKELSAITSVTQPSIAFYAGRRKTYADIGLWNLWRIATVFNVTINDLLDPNFSENESRLPPRRGSFGGRPKNT